MLRKLMSEAERLEKEKRNKRIAGIVLGLIMLLSTAGYFVFDFSEEKTGKVEYAGIEFLQTQYNTWTFSYEGNNYQFSYLPEQTSNISVSITQELTDYSNKPLYISANPIEDIPYTTNQEIVINLERIVQRINFACLDESCSQDYPVKNCSEDNIIIFEISNSNLSKVTQKEKCIVIDYVSGEEEMAVEAFLYRLIGIK
jgi:hypothetical protein